MKDDFFKPLEPSKVSAAKGVEIHPSALVAEGAELGEGVIVGPFALVGPKVKLAEGVQIGAGAAIRGRTSIGPRTKIYDHATLGTSPQDLKYAGEDTELVVGADNMIREYANISLGTKGGGGLTQIGDRNLIMAYTHIAHDCQIDSDCIFANGVQIAGHVRVEDHVVFGGMSGGHQFCSFGRYAMVGAGAIVVKDVLPFTMVQGDRAKPTGLNVVGLRRAEITGDNLRSIKMMYRIIYDSNLTIEQALVKIDEEIADSPFKANFIAFLSKSGRGICR